MNGMDRAEVWIMAKAKLRLVAPTTVNRTVGPRRPPNSELRTREHLTPAEVESLIEAAGKNRQGQRDALMALMAYRHGLRAAEVVDLRWEQVDFKTASLHVRRVKNGTPSTHPLTGRELRELRQHQSTTDLGIKAHAHTPAQPLRRSRDNNPRGLGKFKIRPGGHLESERRSATVFATT